MPKRWEVKKHARSMTVLIALIAAFQLWGQRQSSQQHAPAVVEADGWSDQMAIMERMHAAMNSVERSGRSDVDFVRLMLPHHEAAIEMAKVQLIHGTDPEIRRLAQEIITDQQSEIELMQLWLKRHQLR
jgi:uncharacterized protein (DUF305 family)